MAPKDLAQCASCGADATLRCVGCMDAPEYRRGDSVGTFYCGHDCQKEGWSGHKADCRNLRDRKRMLRIATILKAALLAYKEAVYDIDLTKIEFRDGFLRLHQNQTPDDGRTKRGPFPGHLTTNLEHKEAALAKDQSTTAMSLLGPLTRKLFEGISGSVKVFELLIVDPPMPTQVVPGPEQKGYKHTLLHVRRKTSLLEDWVIDPSGCQYGFRDVLVPFDQYVMNRSMSMGPNPTPYDWTETQDLDHFDTLPLMNTQAQRKDRQLEREARLHFSDFINKRVTTDILNGSGTEFETKLDSFVQELKEHMMSLAK